MLMCPGLENLYHWNLLNFQDMGFTHMMKGSNGHRVFLRYILRLNCIGSFSARPDLVFTLIIVLFSLVLKA